MREQSTKLCECGCGEFTLRVPRNNTHLGWVKGQPFRFVRGHSQRVQPVIEWSPDLWTQEDRGYMTRCWIWQRGSDRHGYGSFKNRTRVQSSSLAHRESYTRARGAIPHGYDLDHLCRVPACVNPEHLEPVTHAENLRRGKTPTLTHDDVRTIRELHVPGTPLHDHALAVRFGVHPRTIYEVLRGHRWT